METNKDTAVEAHVYGGKRVFVFTNHEVALKPWAEVRRTLNSAPLLFTLDHHPDTRPGFAGAAIAAVHDDDPNSAKTQAERQRMIARVRFSDPATVEDAVRLLRWDEQITAAIDTGIVDTALILSGNGQEATWPIERDEGKRFSISSASGGKVVPQRPHHYRVPFDRVFYIPNDFRAGELLADSAIETEFLENKLGHAAEMLASIGRKVLENEPYIFDIDLDYFLTPRSIHPNNATRFHSLLRNAVAVTIALEPGAVRDASSQRMDADTSFAAIRDHLTIALGPRED